jgi:murein DD-endopeptidase MepM/ murein hydrolase activator NlpD
MYEQGTQAAGRRRSVGNSRGTSGKRRPANGQEQVRLLQLTICLILFLAMFLGKGVFPQKLGQVQERVAELISTDFNFQEALSKLGASLPEGEGVLSGVGEFCAEVFGIAQPEEPAPKPVEFQPTPPSDVLEEERAFLSQRSDFAARTARYSGVSRLGLTNPVIVQVEEPAAPPPEEPVVEPEEAPAIPAVGTVISSPEYSGPALPENYTLDHLSLGELATVTPILGHLNSGFGYREHPINGNDGIHSGVDIGAQMGKPIAAFAAGTVEYTGESDACGLYLQLDHGNGIKSFYAHCSEIDVTKGQVVEMGEPVARIGSTGVSTGPHLHFELKYNKTRIDPAYYLTFLER